MRLRWLLFSVLISLATLLNVMAQDTPATRETKEELEKAQHELEVKALKLLDSTLAQTQQFKLTENQVLFQSVAADLLWSRDEKRARLLFQDALNSLSASLVGSDRRNSGGDSYWSLVRLRSQTLQTVARRDPQFALDLLHASRGEFPEGPEREAAIQDETRQEQMIAAQAAEKDPKRALAMAQESLKKGISFSLLGVLGRLQQADPEAATQLGVDLVRKIQTEKLGVESEAQFVAIELLRVLLQSAGENQDPGSRENKERKALVLDEGTLKDLAEAVVRPALAARDNSSNLLIRLQSVLPDLEKRLPEYAPELRRRSSEINMPGAAERDSWSQFAALARNGSPDALIAAAAQAPPQERNRYYELAAAKLMESGEGERARKIVADHLTGAERDQFLGQLDRMAVASDARQGKIDEARKIIARLATKEQRATAYAELAVSIMTDKPNRKLALEVLDEARKEISNPPVNQKQTEALLQVARAYALVEPSRTFALIDPLIDQANEMLAAAAVLDKFGAGQGFFKKGEVVLQNSFLQANGPYIAHLKAVASLARADFDHTKATVNRLQRSEVRLLGCLLITQSILSDHLGQEQANESSFSSSMMLSQ